MFSFMKSLAPIGAVALTFVPLACQAGETRDSSLRRRAAGSGDCGAAANANPAKASSINSDSSTICARDANADCGRETKVAAERNRTCVADARPSEHSNPNS